MTIKKLLAPKLCICIGVFANTPFAFAGFVEDGKTSLELRNFYFDRDFKGDVAQSKRDEWAQGFIANYQSGYTDGNIGFGLDALGMLGLKLDSSPYRSGTGLLPRGSDKRADDDYSKLSATAKVRIAKSEFRVGGLNPVLPLLASNNSRLLPQIFRGAQLVSKDINNLTLTAGRVDAVKLRDSSSTDELTASNQNGAYSGGVTGDLFTYAGFDYQVLPSTMLSYHVGELEDLFRRDFLGLKFSHPLAGGKVFAEARYFRAREAGRELLGEVDNKTISTNFGYATGGHTLAVGYQKVQGDTPFAYMAGTDTYLYSEMQISTFSMANERSLYSSYTYNFAALGIPGLSFNLRYVKGDEADPTLIRTSKAARLRAEGKDGEEWERSTDITYVVQSGPLRDVSLRWRNATNRSNYADSADENRLIISYVINF